MTVLREVFFYGLGLAFLMVALSDRRYVDDGTDVKHIFITWKESLLLVFGYIAYVLVCAYDEPIKAFVKERFDTNEQEQSGNDSTQPLSPVSYMVSEVSECSSFHSYIIHQTHSFCSRLPWMQ
jgi:hypothetical protein